VRAKKVELGTRHGVASISCSQRGPLLVVSLADVDLSGIAEEHSPCCPSCRSVRSHHSAREASVAKVL